MRGKETDGKFRKKFQEGTLSKKGGGVKRKREAAPHRCVISSRPFNLWLGINVCGT